MNLGGSYTEFDKSRRELFELFQYEYSQEESVSFARQTLSDRAVTAYVACLETTARTDPGFYAWISYADEEDVVVTLYWNRPGDVEPTDYNVVLPSGAEDPDDRPKRVPPSQKVSVALEREEGTAFKLFIEGAGYGPYKLLLAAPPKIVLPCFLQSDDDTITITQHEGAVHGLICKTCDGSTCEERSYNTFSTVQVDLACVRYVQNTSRPLIKGFDCSWTPYGPQLQNVVLAPGDRRMEVVDIDCAHLKKMGEDLGLTMPTHFCR